MPTAQPQVSETISTALREDGRGRDSFCHVCPPLSVRQQPPPPLIQPVVASMKSRSVGLSVLPRPISKQCRCCQVRPPSLVNSSTGPFPASSITNPATAHPCIESRKSISPT